MHLTADAPRQAVCGLVDVVAVSEQCYSQLCLVCSTHQQRKIACGKRAQWLSFEVPNDAREDEEYFWADVALLPKQPSARLRVKSILKLPGPLHLCNSSHAKTCRRRSQNQASEYKSVEAMSSAQRPDPPSESYEAKHEEYVKDVKVYFYIYGKIFGTSTICLVAANLCRQVEEGSGDRRRRQ